LTSGIIGGTPDRQGIDVIEEVRDRDIKHPAQIVEPARADPVGATFIFLDLLERKFDGSGELLLAYAKECPPQAHPVADMNIDRTRPPAFRRPLRSTIKRSPHFSRRWDIQGRPVNAIRRARRATASAEHQCRENRCQSSELQRSVSPTRFAPFRTFTVRGSTRGRVLTRSRDSGKWKATRVLDKAPEPANSRPGRNTGLS
jgi:hypothetical protein